MQAYHDLKHEMETAIDLRVPLVVESEIMDHWETRPSIEVRMKDSTQPFVDECKLDGCQRKRYKYLNGKKQRFTQEYCKKHYDLIILKLITHECVVDHCRSLDQRKRAYTLS